MERAEIEDNKKRLLSDTLHRYKEVFSIDGELGKYEEKLFKIDTGDATPSMP